MHSGGKFGHWFWLVLQDAEDVVRAGVFFYVCVKVVRAYPVSPCFTCSSIGQEPDCCWLVVGGFGLGFVVCVVCCLCCFVFSAPGLSF